MKIKKLTVFLQKTQFIMKCLENENSKVFLTQVTRVPKCGEFLHYQNGEINRDFISNPIHYATICGTRKEAKWEPPKRVQKGMPKMKS